MLQMLQSAHIWGQTDNYFNSLSTTRGICPFIRKTLMITVIIIIFSLIAIVDGCDFNEYAWEENEQVESYNYDSEKQIRELEKEIRIKQWKLDNNYYVNNPFVE